MLPPSFEAPAERLPDRQGNSQAWSIECFNQLPELVNALAYSDLPRALALAGALENGSPEKPSQLISLARKYGFTVRGLRDLWSDYKMAQAEAVVRGHLPEIARDIVEDAKSTHVSCPRCDAIGQIKVPEEFRGPEGAAIQVCPQCHGRGTVRKPGDTEARRLLSEAVGLSGRTKAAVSINNNVNTFKGVESVLDEIERMKKKRADLPAAIEAAPTIDTDPEP
jgi:hypothetical protein